MNSIWKMIQTLLIVSTTLLCFGCAEAKLGIGPFKAVSVEAGPGGVEAKGPSAGPFKTKSVEVKPKLDEDK